MNFGIERFANWQTALFCLGVYIIVQGLRALFETIIKTLKTNYYWNDLALPWSPVLLGLGIAMLCKYYPFPDGIVSLSARCLYGMVCGFVSTTVYRNVAAAIANFRPAPAGQAPTGNTGP